MKANENEQLAKQLLDRRVAPVSVIVPNQDEGAPCTFELTYFVC